MRNRSHRGRRLDADSTPAISPGRMGTIRFGGLVPGRQRQRCIPPIERPLSSDLLPGAREWHLRVPVGHRLDGRIQHRVDQFGVRTSADRPADDQAVIAINHRGKVHLAGRDLEFRDVSEPLLFGVLALKSRFRRLSGAGLISPMYEPYRRRLRATGTRRSCFIRRRTTFSEISTDCPVARRASGGMGAVSARAEVRPLDPNAGSGVNLEHLKAGQYFSGGACPPRDA